MGTEKNKQEDCTETKDSDVEVVGDGCADTPLHLNPQSIKDDEDSESCRTVKDTCPNSEGEDPIFNVMNYMDDECMIGFTRDQARLMRDAWDIIRAPGTYVLVDVQH